MRLAKSTYCFILLILTVLSLNFGSASADTSLPAKHSLQKVIFFGNSFTHYNAGIAYHLEQMVKADKTRETFRDYDFRANTVAGARLAEHRDILPVLLSLEQWDAVVLQGHSLEATNQYMSSAFKSTATQMIAQIREANAQPFLFMTWAYQHKPEMIAELSQAYTDLGKQLAVPVVPVGSAFKNALQTDPELELHIDDQIHPTPAGTYLAACTFYAALYKRSPVGNGYQMSLKPELAERLQVIAQQTVQDWLKITN